MLSEDDIPLGDEIPLKKKEFFMNSCKRTRI